MESAIQEAPESGLLNRSGSDGALGTESFAQAKERRLRLRIRRLLDHNRQLFEELRAGEARADIAEQRLKAIKASLLWRSTRVFRRFGSAWHWLVTAWGGGPASPAAAIGLPPTSLVVGASGRVALVIDYRWPRPDQDSGSLDAINLVDTLMYMKYNVAFFADMESNLVNSYRLSLEERGISCLGFPRSMDLLPYLQENGHQIQLCILSRVYAGGNYLEVVQRYCTQAQIVFNPVDLHFIREERQAELSRDVVALATAARTRTRELLMFNEADATIVVSTAEQELLRRLDPFAHVVHLPLARPVAAPQASFEVRRGIGFVGGFEHAPNLDAVAYFLTEIWPLVHRMVPGCEFSIVGTGLPGEMLRKLGPDVRYLGHVPDIAAWFETLRLTVAPLRFGAGAKGKIASSLACGVPCVATAVAVEGMGLADGRAVLLADTPEEFADLVRLAYTNVALSRRLSEAGLLHAKDALSVASYRRGVVGMLQVMGLDATDA